MGYFELEHEWENFDGETCETTIYYDFVPEINDFGHKVWEPEIMDYDGPELDEHEEEKVYEILKRKCEEWERGEWEEWEWDK